MSPSPGVDPATMSQASLQLLELARRVAKAYAGHRQAVAAMVTGSVAKGLADRHSDIDMTIYYEADLPDEAWMADIRSGLGAGERRWLVERREEGSLMEGFPLGGVEVQVGHITLPAWERSMASVLEALDVESPLQKAMEGTLACLPLHGASLIERWQSRLREYPSALGEAMVRKHLSFFPAWGLVHQFQSRDAGLWYQEVLLQSAQNIVGLLSGLNGAYFSTFQLKRTRRLLESFRIAPPRLADRLESLFRLDLPLALAELESLVGETLALVVEHMPQVDTAAAGQRLGWRQSPWDPADFPPAAADSGQSPGGQAEMA